MAAVADTDTLFAAGRAAWRRRPSRERSRPMPRRRGIGAPSGRQVTAHGGDELAECYFSGTQKALIQSCRDMAMRYRAHVAAATGRPEVPAPPAG